MFYNSNPLMFKTSKLYFIPLLQVPNLQWNDVILELDHADFLVKDRQGLSLLFTALRLGLQGHGFHSDRFPVDLLYRHWKHADSQVNLINLQSLQVECVT